MKNLLVGWAGLFTWQLTIGLIAAPIIGALVVHLLLMVILDSSSGDLVSLYLFSVICTLGVGLVVWLLIWYAVGYGIIITFNLILALFGVSITSFMGRRVTAPASPPPTASLSRDQRALLDFMQKARAKGLDRSQMRAKLEENGWSSESINDGFRLADQPS